MQVEYTVGVNQQPQRGFPTAPATRNACSRVAVVYSASVPKTLPTSAPRSGGAAVLIQDVRRNRCNRPLQTSGHDRMGQPVASQSMPSVC